MAIFQPRLQTQVQAREPVRDQTTGSALSAISDIAGGFFDAKASSAPKAPSYDQAAFNEFGKTLSVLEQGLESGSITKAQYETKLAVARSSVASFGNVPDSLQTQYEAMSGRSFESFGYESEQDYDNKVLLEGELAKSLRPSVITSLEAEGIVATSEAVDQALLGKLEEKALLENQVDIQKQKRALGQPIEATPVVESIRSDYSILAEAAKEAMGDGIVEQSEYRSLQMSVNNLIATKYTGFETNPEINGVIKQMTGLLNDIGKGVSTTPSAVLADTIQVTLKSAGFNDSTIAIARGMLEQNPELFRAQFGTDKEGQTVADAIVKIMEGSSVTKPLVDIFDKATAPEVALVAGTNPSQIDIPGVKENPEAYQKVVDDFSNLATTTDINTLRTNQEARNNWLTTMNVVGSAVASQSDNYILGEKLLLVYASNGIIKNLDAIYQFDPQNAAQTNDALQSGLAAERLRQANELNNRLDSGAGEGQLILAGPNGVLQLNDSLITQNAASLPGGEAGWKLMSGKIAAAGGLDAFVKLPMTTIRGANPDVSINVKGQTYFLKDMFRIDFAKVSKLSNNLKLIDTKLGNLEKLATTYKDDTAMLRGETFKDDTDSAGNLDLEQGSGTPPVTPSPIPEVMSEDPVVGVGGFQPATMGSTELNTPAIQQALSRVQQEIGPEVAAVLVQGFQPATMGATELNTPAIQQALSRVEEELGPEVAAVISRGFQPATMGATELNTPATRNALQRSKAGGRVVSVQTEDQYNELKSGTRYRDPNGNIRTKG